VAASDSESRAVFRIFIPANFFRSEVRELTAGGPVERLHPQIVHTFFPHRIKNRLSGRHERQAGEPARIEFERRFLSILDRISNEDRGVIRFARLECGNGLAVGRNVIGLGRRLDDCLGSAAVDGNTLEEMVFQRHRRSTPICRRSNRPALYR